MRINSNLMAMNAHRQLGTNQMQGAKTLEKLSSGLRINRAGDDAAGLAISEKMRGQIRGLNQASRNAQDGISLIQTAEGALNETHAILQRMRELAVQSANDTNTTVDRGEIQKEIDELAKEISRIAQNTEYNTQNLLNGTFTGKFQIGGNAGQNLELSISNMNATALGVDGSTTTYSGGTVSSVTGTAENVAVSMGTDVSFDTSNVTVTTEYTSQSPLVTGSVDNEYAELNITWTQEDTESVGDSAAVNFSVGGASNENWSVTENNSGILTLVNSVTSETFTFDATGLTDQVASDNFAFDQADTTYGGTIVVDDTTFAVGADGTTTVNVSGTYDDLAVSVGAGFEVGSGTGSFDITGQTAATTSTTYECYIPGSF